MTEHKPPEFAPAISALCPCFMWTELRTWFGLRWSMRVRRAFQENFFVAGSVNGLALFVRVSVGAFFDGLTTDRTAHVGHSRTLITVSLKKSIFIWIVRCRTE
jgi:hypothetical protein